MEESVALSGAGLGVHVSSRAGKTNVVIHGLDLRDIFTLKHKEKISCEMGKLNLSSYTCLFHSEMCWRGTKVSITLNTASIHWGL